MFGGGGWQGHSDQTTSGTSWNGFPRMDLAELRLPGSGPGGNPIPFPVWNGSAESGRISFCSASSKRMTSAWDVILHLEAAGHLVAPLLVPIVPQERSTVFPINDSDVHGRMIRLIPCSC